MNKWMLFLALSHSSLPHALPIIAKGSGASMITEQYCSIIHSANRLRNLINDTRIGHDILAGI